ncbi:hypothetical protein B0J18DRAFT_420101 [Chaetomium sp. MPI-SDFR-AT-0129]|nr:hypothetical protein B0J18DRAFT_420101 [Chaetomium sp. MPI-SDFR-AT-0129]
MLIRILADNPGPGFTRYMDKKFVDATKDLLRTGRDPSVRQLLMETLDSFETSKALDEGLGPTIEMWKKEKEKAYRAYGGTSVAPVPPPNMMQPFNPYQQAHHSLPHHRPVHAKPLPDPVELANRLEEARTSAKLLEQVVACTPPSEVLSNELIKEFSDRCSSASRSIQGYMAADSPGPDNDTMESLIDTNEQLQQALNHHRRAVLQAKKQLHGADSPASESSPAPQLPPVAEETRPPVSPPVPARRAGGSGFGGSGFGGGGLGISSGKGKASLDPYDAAAAATAASPIAGPSRSGNGTPRHDDTDDDGQDPFRDPPTETATHYHASGSSSSRPVGGASDTQQRLSFEPFHPGFGGGAGGSSSAARGAEKGKTEPVTPVSDEGGSDVYGATPRVDDHVYRY